MIERPFIFAITGGSGAGKTTFAKRVLAAIGEEHCAVLSQDRYYLNPGPAFRPGGGGFNFDDPRSLEFRLLQAHLATLREGLPAVVPVFDPASHTRLEEPEIFLPKSLVLVDGTLLLSQVGVRVHLDASIYLDVPEAIRFERRLRQDVIERGRNPESVQAQWTQQVQPMFEQFVEPSKAHATWVANCDADLDDCLENLHSRPHS